MQIKHRLTLLFTALVGVILLLFSMIIYFSSVEYRKAEFYLRLKQKALSTAHILFNKEHIDLTFLKEMDARDLTVLYQEEVMIYNEQLETIYDSGEDTVVVPPGFLLQVKSTNEIRSNNGKQEIIGVRYPFQGRHYIVVASAVDIYGHSKLSNLRNVLVSGWFISISIILLAGRWFSNKALRPISKMLTSVEKISFSNLKSRLDIGNGKDEMAALSKKFNEMLGRLEQSVESQKTFISNASHELRTPLTAISGEIEITLSKERSNEDYREALVSIFEEAKMLTDLYNGLLELARVSGDKAGIGKSRIRIDEILWQAREDLLKKKPNYKADVDIDSMPDESELIIDGNEGLLRTAFLNLMDNACKFSAGKAVKVVISAYSNSTKIRFIDEGIGVPAADLKNIFDPYYRASNAYHYKGFGIGLPLILQIVQIHKSELDVASTVGKGSIFTITFPRG